MEKSRLVFADFWSLRYSAGGDPLTRIFSQRLGAIGAYLSYRAGLTPSQVTLLGGAVFAVGAWLYFSLPPGAASAFSCIALFEIAYGLDCADGQLARATAKTSVFGGWLDIAVDYARNVALAMALLLWLQKNQTLSLEATAGACLLLLTGAVVQLHTAVSQRKVSSTELPITRSMQLPRRVFVFMVDTATYVLMLGLLRDAGWLLPFYMCGMGCAYLFTAIFLAVNRLPGPQ